MPEGGGRVQFDFEGSLQLARQLWGIADDVQTEDDGRETQYDTAKAKWLGTYADQFVGRREDERTSRATVVAALREDARLWAQAWARALDQQNKNNRAAEVERIRDDRGLFERGWDSTFGEDDSDDQVPMPEPVSVPTAPSFLPTASEITY
jgi:hypothetical protein